MYLFLIACNGPIVKQIFIKLAMFYVCTLLWSVSSNFTGHAARTPGTSQSLAKFTHRKSLLDL